MMTARVNLNLFVIIVFILLLCISNTVIYYGYFFCITYKNNKIM